MSRPRQTDQVQGAKVWWVDMKIRKTQGNATGHRDIGCEGAAVVRTASCHGVTDVACVPVAAGGQENHRSSGRRGIPTCMGQSWNFIKKGNYLLSALWCHKYFWKKDWWNLPNSCRGVRSWSCLFGDGQFLGRIFQRLLPVVSLPFPIFRSGGSNPFQWELRRNREKYWNLDPCRKRQF